MNQSLDVINTPLSNTKISNKWKTSLQKHGIITLGQLYERASQSPKNIATLLNTNASKLCKKLESDYKVLKQCHRAIQSSKPWPAITGIAGHSDSHPVLLTRRQKSQNIRNDVQQRVRVLKKQNKLPAFTLLSDYLPPVYDQGMLGSCTGFGSTASRDYLAQKWMSPGFAYRLAKHLDGCPNEEGSFQAFCFEGYYKHGHVPYHAYSYQDTLNSRPIEPLFNTANKHKITGYVDLMPDTDYSIIPNLMRAVLSGTLFSTEGPRNIAVSLALYESFHSYSTQRTGLVTLPLPGEKLSGGHAMNIVGYLDANAENGLLNTDWFIVRNSWGSSWAQENPLNLPGHALIPARYFLQHKLMWELLIAIAEASPAQNSWMNNLMRRYMNVVLY